MREPAQGDTDGPGGLSAKFTVFDGLAVLDGLAPLGGSGLCWMASLRSAARGALRRRLPSSLRSLVPRSLRSSVQPPPRPSVLNGLAPLGGSGRFEAAASLLARSSLVS